MLNAPGIAWPIARAACWPILTGGVGMKLGITGTASRTAGDPVDSSRLCPGDGCRQRVQVVVS